MVREFKSDRTRVDGALRGYFGRKFKENFGKILMSMAGITAPLVPTTTHTGIARKCSGAAVSISETLRQGMTEGDLEFLFEY